MPHPPFYSVKTFEKYMIVFSICFWHLTIIYLVKANYLSPQSNLIGTYNYLLENELVCGDVSMFHYQPQKVKRNIRMAGVCHTVLPDQREASTIHQDLRSRVTPHLLLPAAKNLMVKYLFITIATLAQTKLIYSLKGASYLSCRC